MNRQAGRARIRLGLAAAVLALAACAGSPPGGPSAPKQPPRSLEPASSGVQAPASAARQIRGTVLGLDGKPLAGVLVRGFVAADNGGGFISENGGALLGSNGSGLVSNNGGGVVSNNGGKYRLATVGLETRTDAGGRFALPVQDERPVNVEAVAADDIKAFEGSVAGGGELSLQLAYTGAIAGRVTAPQAPTVTDFEGVEVFIPGTSYAARTTRSGHFELTGVPAGSFELVARKLGLGVARKPDVRVKSKQVTSVPALELAVALPEITSLSPVAGAPGTEVAIAGKNFGTSDASLVEVTFGGATATEVRRSSDGSLVAKVPASAASGDVVVTVNGNAGVGKPFAVVARLALPGAYRHLHVGSRHQYRALALDAGGRPIDGLPIAWSAEAASGAIAVAEDGTVSAKAVGSATLTASLGTLKASLRLNVHDAADAVVNTIAGGAPGYAEGPADQARFRAIASLALDAAGNLIIADRENHRIRKLDPRGLVTTLAGGADGEPRDTGAFADGPGAEARFYSPSQVLVDAGGGVIVTDRDNAVVRRIDGATGRVATIAGTGDTFTYEIVDGSGPTVRFFGPGGAALAANGDVFLLDGEVHGAIRRLTPAGLVETVAGSRGPRPYDDVVPPQLRTMAAAEARFVRAVACAFGPDGMLYVADRGDHVVRRFDPTAKTVVAVVGGLEPRPIPSGNAPSSLPSDQPSAPPASADPGPGAAPDEELDLRDKASLGARRGLETGPALATALDEPTALAVAPDGTLYVALSPSKPFDPTAFRNSPAILFVRGGEVYSLLIGGFAGERLVDGPGYFASLHDPTALCLSRDGRRLYFADGAVIRAIDLPPDGAP